MKKIALTIGIIGLILIIFSFLVFFNGNKYMKIVFGNDFNSDKENYSPKEFDNDNFYISNVDLVKEINFYYTKGVRITRKNTHENLIYSNDDISIQINESEDAMIDLEKIYNNEKKYYDKYAIYKINKKGIDSFLIKKEDSNSYEEDLIIYSYFKDKIYKIVYNIIDKSYSKEYIDTILNNYSEKEIKSLSKCDSDGFCALDLKKYVLNEYIVKFKIDLNKYSESLNSRKDSLSFYVGENTELYINIIYDNDALVSDYLKFFKGNDKNIIDNVNISEKNLVKYVYNIDNTKYYSYFNQLNDKIALLYIFESSVDLDSDELIKDFLNYEFV